MSISSKDLFGESTITSYHQDFKIYPHQANVVMWMKIVEWRISDPQYMKGGILADDMGMGKTNEICALIATTYVPSTLILAPISTKYQWIETLLKYCQNINIYTVLDGKYLSCSLETIDGESRVVTKALKMSKGSTIIPPMIVVANSELVTLATTNNKLVTDINWCRIVVDEGHILRINNDSWNKMNQLKQPTVFSGGKNHRYGSRWIVSGSPIQMDDSDIVNIFKFIDGRFFEDLPVANKSDMVNYLMMNNLFRRTVKHLTPYMKTVLKIPDKEPINTEVNIELKETELSQILERMSYEEIYYYCQNNPSVINNILTDERSYFICKAAELKYQLNASENGSFTSTAAFRTTMSFPYLEIPGFMSDITKNYNLVYTGLKSKVSRVYNQLQSDNDSYIIFHHYEKVGTAIYDMIKLKFSHIKLFAINGSTSQASDIERYNIIKDSAKFIRLGIRCIIVCSIGTSAEGMNFQAFSKVMKIDREYNLTVESQADSRVYRIGQLNQVYIYNFMVNRFTYGYGTVNVDEHIKSIRDSKEHLIQKIDHYNAAYTYRRYYVTLEDGRHECGIHFNDQFESLPQGSLNGPNSVGPDWIR